MKWQPIETAPKDGTEILVINDKTNGGYHTESLQIGVAYFGKGGFDKDHWYSTVCCDGVSYFIPTHWMPLPPAPDEQTN